MNETDYSKYTVLVVDDIPVNILLVKGMLSRFKFNVVSANSGKEALEMMESSVPDVVLMDVMMPVMNGFDTTRAIRSNPAISHVPVIILSALNSDADIKEGISAGANDFITKPFIQERIINSIANQITLSEKRKQSDDNASGFNPSMELMLRMAAATTCIADAGYAKRLNELVLCLPHTLIDAGLFNAGTQSEEALTTWAVGRIHEAKLQKAEVDVKETISKLKDILSPALGKRINTDIKGAAGTIKTDAALFRSLLSNLMSCACRMAVNEVNATLTAEGGVLSLQLECAANADTPSAMGITLANETAAALGGSMIYDSNAGRFSLHLLMQL